MKTKSGKFFASISMIGLLASLSTGAAATHMFVDTPEIRTATQNAKTRGDHEAIARYYEEAATQMKAKLEKQKELLAHYEDKSYLYGRQAQDLQSHTEALVRDYEETVSADIREASLHRQMASKLEENHATVDVQSPTL
ncbi:MAG: hypothetical protein ABJA60_05520 [Nitrosospira sp.]